jgi:molecular chaperone GrpE
MAQNMKIKIQNGKQTDRTADDADGDLDPLEETETWPADREPINLDGTLSISDAMKAAEKIKAESADAGAVPGATKTPDKDEPKASEQDAAAARQAAASAEEVEALKAENEQLKGNYMRALADVQNMKRRTAEEMQRKTLHANESLIKEMLPLVDEFEMALAAAKQAESYEQVVSGVDAILRKFHDILKKQGIETISAVGEKFDPDVHEAVMIDEESDQPDETVTQELRKGYLYHGSVLRPSLVKVAKPG